MELARLKSEHFRLKDASAVRVGRNKVWYGRSTGPTVAYYNLLPFRNVDRILGKDLDYVPTELQAGEGLSKSVGFAGNE